MSNKKSLGLAIGAILAASMLQATAANRATELKIVPMAAGDAAASPAGASRLIVKYRAGNAGNARTTMASAVARVGLVQSGKAGTSSAKALEAKVLRKQASGAQVLRVSRRLSSVELDNLLTELRADPAVEYAEVDTMMQPVKDLSVGVVSPLRETAASLPAASVQSRPDDPYFAGYQWHLLEGPGGIHAPAAWDISTGAGVVVAVLDTGILPEHPDLKSGQHILEGYDFISDAATSRRSSDARVAGALDYGDWTESGNECGRPVEDSSWHGTHTAGTVAELTNNGIGGAGVAHDAQVLPIRVLGRCGGYASDIADAIVWASGGQVEGVPDNAHPAEVISLSLGGAGTCSATYQNAIDTAVSNGSVVVVAAGNNAANANNYSPASCNNVITVGATGITGAMAYYSNYGSKVDLSGPGGGGQYDTGNDGWDGYVLQAGYSGATTPSSGEYRYVGMAGTSMAAPHVAATAALVQSALVAAGASVLSAADMESLLKRTVTTFAITPPGATPVGTGILNAKLAVDKALEAACDEATQECPLVALPLANKVASTQLTGVDSSQSLYSFEASAGSALTLMTYSGNGNLKLYVRFGGEPSADDYDAKSERTGVAQTLRIAKPQAGTYYVKVVGGSGGYRGVSLMARQ